MEENSMVWRVDKYIRQRDWRVNLSHGIISSKLKECTFKILYFAGNIRQFYETIEQVPSG